MRDFRDLPEEFEEVACKNVLDSDGFWTEYTLYRQEILVDSPLGARTGYKWVFVFGNRDYYSPEDECFDYETYSEEDAWEWYDNYNGFEDEEIWD